MSFYKPLSLVRETVPFGAGDLLIIVDAASFSVCIAIIDLELYDRGEVVDDLLLEVHIRTMAGQPWWRPAH